MHTVKTTVVTGPTGEITGYGFCVEAEHSGGFDEIAAAITVSLEMLRTTITTSFAGLTATAQIPINPPTRAPNEAQSPAPSPQPPASSEEAEARFYVRYSAIIGGGDWADVRRYLRQPRKSEPTTVEQWIAVAEAVRDRSKQATPAAPTQGDYAQH